MFGANAAETVFVLLILCCLLFAMLLVRAIEKLDGSVWSDQHITRELLRSFVHISLFCIVYLLTWRPVTTLIITIFAVACLTLSNLVKKRVVFEPIVFSDIGLLGQIVRNPKLYFVDNSIISVVTIVTLFILLGLAFWLEPPVLPSAPIYVIAVIAWISLYSARAQLRRRFSSLLLDEQSGFGSACLGLLPALVLQFICWLDWCRSPRTELNAAIPGDLPHCDVIVVQLESFIDLTPYIDDHHSIWPELQAKSSMHGKLQVPARGANTMRTEHAVLSGVGNAVLQFDRFDPYLRRGSGIKGIVSALRDRGWSSVFIHPNDLGFFRRDKALPELGFDLLLGQEVFKADRPIGPYIGDTAVVREVIGAAHSVRAPRFIFAVTMENHGPWKAGRLPSVAPGLPSYLAHQRNTDAALRCLLDLVSGSHQRVILVVYGDHAPTLSSLPAGIDPSVTDYVILDSASASETSLRRDVRPEDLLRLALTLN